MTTVKMREPRGTKAREVAEPLVDQTTSDLREDADGGDKLAQFIASIPNFKVESASNIKANGVESSQLAITFGSPAVVVMARVLDVADHWDLAEVAGASSGNEQYMMMARAAAAVTMIGQTSYMPGRSGMTKDHLRRVMRALGVLGLNAVTAAQAGIIPGASTANPADVAKNS